MKMKLAPAVSALAASLAGDNWQVVPMANSEHERSVYSRSNAIAGDVMLRVPFHRLITENHGATTPLGKLASSMGASSNDLLCCWLATAAEQNRNGLTRHNEEGAAEKAVRKEKAVKKHKKDKKKKKEKTSNNEQRRQKEEEQK